MLLMSPAQAATPWQLCCLFVFTVDASVQPVVMQAGSRPAALSAPQPCVAFDLCPSTSQSPFTPNSC